MWAVSGDRGIGTKAAVVGGWAVLGIFILSGAAGLIYEIVWARQLVLVFGNTTQAVSAILTGFFGGMAIGADPITAAILTLAGVEGLPLRGVMVRKEPKQHGTGKYVEGPFMAGEELVIVEDVVTTGGSSLLAIERCEAAGLKVRRVLAIVDRLEGGREAFAQRGYELTTLLTIEDFGIAPPGR